MFSRFVIAAVPFLVVLPLVIGVGRARSEGLPEGVTATVIAEHPSAVPGVEKVRLVRVMIEPGKGFARIEVTSEEYCELKSGALMHVSHDTNVVDLYTTGARWAPPKGT